MGTKSMQGTATQRRKTLRKLATAALLAAICVLLNMTSLGIIPIPPAGIAVLHIPVILAVVLEGPWIGLFMGLVFGLSSMWSAIARPTLLAPLFLDPLIAILPRLLIPLAVWGVYKLCMRFWSRKKWGTDLSVALSAVAGTLTNTVFVLLLIYLRYASKFGELMSVNVEGVGAALVGIGLLNGALETAAAVILCVPIARAVRAYRKKRPV